MLLKVRVCHTFATVGQVWVIVLYLLWILVLRLKPRSCDERQLRSSWIDLVRNSIEWILCPETRHAVVLWMLIFVDGEVRSCFLSTGIASCHLEVSVFLGRGVQSRCRPEYVLNGGVWYRSLCQLQGLYSASNFCHSVGLGVLCIRLGLSRDVATDWSKRLPFLRELGFGNWCLALKRAARFDIAIDEPLLDLRSTRGVYDLVWLNEL